MHGAKMQSVHDLNVNETATRAGTHARVHVVGSGHAESAFFGT